MTEGEVVKEYKIEIYESGPKNGYEQVYVGFKYVELQEDE